MNGVSLTLIHKKITIKQYYLFEYSLQILIDLNTSLDDLISINISQNSMIFGSPLYLGNQLVPNSHGSEEVPIVSLLLLFFVTMGHIFGQFVHFLAVIGLDFCSASEDILQFGHNALLGFQSPVQTFQLVVQLNANIWKITIMEWDLDFIESGVFYILYVLQ